MKTDTELYDKVFDNRASKSIQELLTIPDEVKNIGKLIAEQEAVANKTDTKLSENGILLKANFDRDLKSIGHRLSALKDTMYNKPGVYYKLGPQLKNLLHFFIPNRNRTGDPYGYNLKWELMEGTVQEKLGKSDFRNDVNTGMFCACHAVEGNGNLSTYAGLGVRFTPLLDQCMLRVTPIIDWEGHDHIIYRVIEPHLNPFGKAIAGAQIGLHVQSWDADGGGFRTDARQWKTIWERSELNPPSRFEYYSDFLDGRSLELNNVLAFSDRRYAIWVSCRTFVYAHTTFGAETFAYSNVMCFLRFLCVEEINL